MDDLFSDPAQTANPAMGIESQSVGIKNAQDRVVRSCESIDVYDLVGAKERPQQINLVSNPVNYPNGSFFCRFSLIRVCSHRLMKLIAKR